MFRFDSEVWVITPLTLHCYLETRLSLSSADPWGALVHALSCESTHRKWICKRIAAVMRRPLEHPEPSEACGASCWHVLIFPSTLAHAQPAIPHSIRPRCQTASRPRANMDFITARRMTRMMAPFYWRSIRLLFKKQTAAAWQEPIWNKMAKD